MRQTLKTLMVLSFLGSISTFPKMVNAEEKNFYVGAGTFFQNMFKVSSDNLASMNYWGQTYLPDLVFGYRFEPFFPTLSWTVFGKKIEDGEKRRTVFRLDFPYLLPKGRIEAKASVGVFYYRISGDSSTVTLRNGSSTSSFYVPGGSVGSALAYMGLGIGFPWKNWRGDLDLLASGLLSRRRALHLSLRGGYVF